MAKSKEQMEKEAQEFDEGVASLGMEGSKEPFWFATMGEHVYQQATAGRKKSNFGKKQ